MQGALEMLSIRHDLIETNRPFHVDSTRFDPIESSPFTDVLSTSQKSICARLRKYIAQLGNAGCVGNVDSTRFDGIVSFMQITGMFDKSDRLDC